jgi:hypothetical protein
MPLSVSNLVASNDIAFQNPPYLWTQRWPADLQGLQLMRIIGETPSPVKKIQQKQGREIVHLDKPTLRKQSILKMPFQNPISSSAGPPFKPILACWGLRSPRLRKTLTLFRDFGGRAALQGREKIVHYPCHSDRFRRSNATEEEWRNPENVSLTMPHQGVLSNLPSPFDVPSRTEAPPYRRQLFDAHWC